MEGQPLHEYNVKAVRIMSNALHDEITTTASRIPIYDVYMPSVLRYDDRGDDEQLQRLFYLHGLCKFFDNDINGVKQDTRKTFKYIFDLMKEKTTKHIGNFTKNEYVDPSIVPYCYIDATTRNVYGDEGAPNMKAGMFVKLMLLTCVEISVHALEPDITENWNVSPRDRLTLRHTWIFYRRFTYSICFILSAECNQKRTQLDSLDTIKRVIVGSVYNHTMKNGDLDFDEYRTTTAIAFALHNMAKQGTLGDGLRLPNYEPLANSLLRSVDVKRIYDWYFASDVAAAQLEAANQGKRPANPVKLSARSYTPPSRDYTEVKRERRDRLIKLAKLDLERRVPARQPQTAAEGVAATDAAVNARVFELQPAAPALSAAATPSTAAAAASTAAPAPSAAAAPSTAAAAAASKLFIETDDDGRPMCIVCYYSDENMVKLQNCNHVCLCETCAAQLKKCPKCFSPYESFEVLGKPIIDSNLKQ
mgnify:CR=1 FL=1